MRSYTLLGSPYVPLFFSSDGTVFFLAHFQPLLSLLKLSVLSSPIARVRENRQAGRSIGSGQSLGESPQPEVESQ